MPTAFTRGAGSALALGWARITAFLDPYFEYVSMLLPGNGTNGAQNNTFLDSSTNNFTITRNGNTTQGTFSPYGSNWSYFSAANGNYLTVPQNTAFAFGTGDFTIEAWVYKIEASRQQAIVDTRGAGGGAVGVLFYVTSQAYLTVFDGTGTVVGGSAATVLPGYQANAMWTHVAVTRSGTTIRLWINGTSVASATDTRNYANGATGTYVGRQFGSTANDWAGFISNVRVVKGTALYTSTFTPSTTPLTAVSGTSLLTCQSNRFVDNSGNNFTVTPSGTPSVQRFSPFSPSAAYSTTTIGGSSYFDGTGDYLSIADATALDLSGDWTIEGWFNVSSSAGASSYLGFVTKWASGQRSYYISLDVAAKGIYTSISTNGSGNSDLSSSSNVWTFNTWNHLALVVSGGGATRTIYVNGVNVGSTTMPGTPFNGTSAVQISGDGTITSAMYGYLSDVRIVKGTAVYTANFTPPTAPLTAITNTSLLCNFTNAGIIDNAMMSNLETAGNAQISTAQSKFGGSSMYFDGTGDYVLTNPATSNLYTFGTSEFTIEMWIYLTNVSVAQVIFDTRPSGTNGLYPDIYFNNSNSTFNWYINSADRITSSAVSINTWYHVAVCRSTTSTKMFVNGTQAGSTYTDSNNYLCAAQRPVIGVNATDLVSSPFFGYIDDLRVTRGVARYTSNFTAPTAPFPTS